jgi:N-6 DNA Methylase
MLSTTSRPYLFAGNLLVTDITKDLVSNDYPGQMPKDFDLGEKAKLADEIALVWGIAKAHWVAFQQALGRLDENDPATSVTREQWVLPLLRALGYDPFYTAKAEIIDNQTYAISHRSGQRRRNVGVDVDQRLTQCEGSYDLLGTANLENKPPLHIIGCRVGLEKRSESGKPRISAHGLLQEYLNRTEHLWGVVTNGLQWRLLRDSSLMTKLTYVEFDLDQIMKGENFAEFGLFYRLFHRSRLPENMEDSNKCLLEDYHQLTLQQGGRVRDKLRDGVEKSIEQLANGFLQHPKNEALRQRVASGEILATEYYRQLLMLIYRLLFLMVAESRDLLLNDHETDLEQRRIYEAYYSIEKLRLLAESPSLRREGFQDLWRGLMVTFQLFDEHWRGQALGLSPLNGDLFGSKALSYIDGYAIDNYDLLTAIKNLSRYDHVSAKGQAAQSRRVNYESLDVEELGSIYESLLDFHPQFLVEANNPAFNPPKSPLERGTSGIRLPLSKGAGGIEFLLVKGSDRKSTGSYYTPPELVAQLIKTALEPVIADKLAGLSSIEEREAALLSITVCDPSCGSGHFLLAAARRLGKELARVRTEEHQPGLDDLRPAVRDVIQHCIYGVDLNPLAIDLCKVALWIEGYNKNRPLSFLDHRIKCGNSLVGVLDLDCLAGGIPDGAFNAVTGDDKSLVTKLKKRNKDELKDIDQRCLWDLEVVRAGRVSYALSAEQVGDIEEVTAQDVKSKQESYLRGRSDAVWLRDYTLCNVWTAAFFTPLLEQQLGVIPTTAVLFSLMAGSSVFQTVAEAANALAAEKSFFHWCLEFPEVFQDGGFSCILGNPPWERIKLQEKEFFAARDAEIANSQNAASRQRLIKELPLENPELLQEFEIAKYDAASQGRFVRGSSRFALTAVGDINTYSIFSETARKLISSDGRAGIIVPTGIATDDTCKQFFKDICESQQLNGLYSFDNKVYFKDVGLNQKLFSLMSLGGKNFKFSSSEFSFYVSNVSDLNNPERVFTLTPQDIALINPNTLTSPVFRTRADAELTRKIYQRVPVLENERTGVNPWGISFMRMLDMSNDSGSFVDSPSANTLPLYEAKMLHQFDHRWATYEGLDVRDSSLPEKQDPDFAVTPRYWVDKQEVDNKLAGKWDKQWLLAFRDITNATNERTSIASFLPRVGVGNNAPIMILKETDAALVSCLQANLSSLVFDFVARHKVGGTHMNFFIVKQLPVLAPKSYTPQDIEFISSRVLELVYTAWDMQPFAQDMGYKGAPFAWNPARRALLRAELDAKYAKLYGLTREELRYILDPSDIYGAEFPSETFRVLKNKELKEHGEYRTQRLVLAAWDLLESGKPMPSEARSIEDFQMLAVPSDAAVVDLKTV